MMPLRRTILILVALLLTTPATPALSQHHHGLFSGAVPGARLVFPVKVCGRNGSLYDLEHHHDVLHRDRKERRLARSAPDDDVDAPAEEATWLPDTRGDEPAVQYDVALEPGESAPSRLLLWASTSFLAPALRVDRLLTTPTSSLNDSDDAARSSRSGRRARSITTCHYHGVVQGDPHSRVAVSACGKGLVGFVKTSRADYWLEPRLEPAVADARNAASPHLVFRRRGRRERRGPRGRTEGRSGRRQRPAGPSRGRKKNRTGPKMRTERRRRRRRHDKDCGTRDRGRANETSHAWSRAGRGAGRGAGPHRRRPGGRRSVRSVSRERHVEVLLVADHTMAAFHQDGDLETYLLTIMNMVSAMYHDPTIGNLINVAVVRIITMDEWTAEDTFNSTVNADRTLTSFCRWASEINPADESDPHHHDVAVLVTRVDICARRDTPCNTLGVAHVGGMCTADRACSVNQDNGIVLAHTIAHEMGHNFGMTHDTETTGCPRKVDNVLHVMTPTFEADNHRMAWSRCSRNMLTAFLDEGKGACLDDQPTLGGFQYPDLPAGSMYDAEHQCRLQFGADEAGVCSDMEEVCARLWCELDGQCTTLLQPAAPGTVCGKHKWCQDQQCVEIGDLPEPVPGGWSSWGEWGPCSRTCGAGVSIMERSCDHPAPRHGGAYCLGERRRYRVCNTQPCPEGTPGFRAVQCAGYNNRTYHGANYTWLPYFDSAEPCELYCADSDDTVIVPWGGAVADGTPCNVGRRDMCIGRVCRKVGCDWAVDSDAVEDRCGVCRGDGSQCDTVSGAYNRPDGYGYIEAFQIPSSARNVVIEEVSPSKNFIGIGSSTKAVFYLNGRRKITLPGEYEVGGTVALYERVGDLETVRIPGPLRDSILIYVIFRGRARNPGLRYQYTVRRPGVVAPSLSWEWADWAPCSATCGGGRQELRAVCASAASDASGPPRALRHLKTVADEECEAAVGPRPPDKSRTCATHACPATWWTGPWQLCTATCGDSVARRRSVLCVVRGRQEMALPDAECDAATRPAEQERCTEVPACPTTTTTTTTTTTATTNTSTAGPAGDAAADLFPVTLSRPSPAPAERLQDVLEMDGLDLQGLAQDERDFLSANYSAFLHSLGDGEQTVPDKRPPTAGGGPDGPGSRPGPAGGSGGGGGGGRGAWEDDMELPQSVRPRYRPHPSSARPLRPRKLLPWSPSSSRNKSKPAKPAKPAHKKRKQARPKDTFFLTFE